MRNKIILFFRCLWCIIRNPSVIFIIAKYKRYAIKAIVRSVRESKPAWYYLTLSKQTRRRIGAGEAVRRFRKITYFRKFWGLF